MSSDAPSPAGTPTDGESKGESEGESKDETHKLWGGRFASGPHPLLDAVNRSIGVDYRLWPHDVRLSKAWSLALAEAGIYSREEAETVREGLDRVADRLAAGVEPVATDEDIHTMIDRLLHEEAGSPASRLHTGRSRNDQVATATRLWTMHACEQIVIAVRTLQQALVTQADTLQDAVLPAYTHLQRAQPVSGTHWLLSHFWALERDVRRLQQAAAGASVMPLGSGAIAGSAFPINRELLRSELGFAEISANSIDATGDRDFVAEALFACALAASHCSRLAEDLILYGSSEFGFVKFGDQFSTGSSMMPQKRNPDVFELARGSGGRVLGDLVSMLATLKGLPSGYSKDLQDDKRALFNAVDMLLLVLPATAGAVAELRFDTARMRAAVTGGMMATDLADYLVRKGMSFREAHGVVGRLVREAEQAGRELDELPLAQVQAAHELCGADVMESLGIEASLAVRKVPGGTAPSAVRDQLAEAHARLAAAKARHWDVRAP